MEKVPIHKTALKVADEEYNSLVSCGVAHIVAFEKGIEMYLDASKSMTKEYENLIQHSVHRVIALAQTIETYLESNKKEV